MYKTYPPQRSKIGPKSLKRLLASLLAGKVYDLQTAGFKENLCEGTHCYQPTFFTISFLCGIGALLAVLLTKINYAPALTTPASTAGESIEDYHDTVLVTAASTAEEN